MDETFQIDDAVMRQTLMQECGNQNMQIVQLKAAVQQLLGQVEMLTIERDTLQADVNVDETEAINPS